MLAQDTNDPLGFVEQTIVPIAFQLFLLTILVMSCFLIWKKLR